MEVADIGDSGQSDSISILTVSLLRVDQCHNILLIDNNKSEQKNNSWKQYYIWSDKSKEVIDNVLKYLLFLKGSFYCFQLIHCLDLVERNLFF